MKIGIQNTSRVVEINGVPARVWEGTTETGIPVVCYITRIAVPGDEDQSEFQKELQECPAPSESAMAIPARMVL